MESERTESPIQGTCVSSNTLLRTLYDQDSASLMSPNDMSVRISTVLDELQPSSVAIPGWSGSFALEALDWCIRHSTPAVLLSDSTQHDWKRYYLKELLKKCTVKLFSSALVAGNPQSEYLKSLGMPSECIFAPYDVVDNDHFQEKSEMARRHSEENRIKLRLPSDFFLFVGRFVPVKNLVTMLNGFKEYRSLAGKSPKWELVMIGDGIQRLEVESTLNRLDLTSSVHLLGFKDYSELPQYYGLAGALVLASTSETWGLVVNEAMASGLPIVISRNCGCQRDLVQDGINGFSFCPQDPHELAQKLYRISRLSPEDRQKMSQASQQIISRFSANDFCNGLTNAFKYAVSKGCPKASLANVAALRVLRFSFRFDFRR